jgi:hypothetical protein
VNFYRLLDDISCPGRWYLGNVNVEDNWIFTYGMPVDETRFQNLIVEIYQSGREMDYSITEVYGVPVVSERLTEWLYEYMDDVQLMPIKVPNASKNYFILVVKNKINCVDERKSNFQKYEVDNEVRPDKAGDYEAIYDLKIDPTNINKNIFRLAKYDIVTIMNEDVKLKLEKAALSGLRFELVT